MSQTQRQDPRLDMTLAELRAWLDSQNAEYLRQQSATEADHTALVRQIEKIVEEVQKGGKR